VEVPRSIAPIHHDLAEAEQDKYDPQPFPPRQCCPNTNDQSVQSKRRHANRGGKHTVLERGLV
jgi:hypothetical protein